MGTVTIQDFTTEYPITMIGKEAGVCWNADTKDTEKNYRRGVNCLKSEHGRTFEFPDVYMILDGYSARVIREWYTHIGGSPTRLQASTRYINYQKEFDYVIPPSLENNEIALDIYENIMRQIKVGVQRLEEFGIPKEDIALCYPLGMKTKIVCKHNLRNLIDMSHQRMCTRAYHEYRQLFGDVCNALKNYSPEWEYLVTNYFQPKCQYTGFCKEQQSCGLMPQRKENNKWTA